MGTGMDSHGRRKMAIKVLKIAVGSCMAVAVAQFFELPYATSAGIVTLLTVQNTRRDTIRLAAIPVVPILEAGALAVAACLLATCIPLRRISKMSVVEAIEAVE